MPPLRVERESGARRAGRGEEQSPETHKHTRRARTATNANSHGRRSFLVFMAASARFAAAVTAEVRRFFVAVMAEVFSPSWRSRRRSFYTNTTTTRNPLYIRLPPFITAGTCLGSVPLRSTRAVRRFFWKKSKKKNNPKQPPKIALPLAVSEGHEGQRRPSVCTSVEVTEVFCGHDRWSWRSRAEADSDLAVEENANASSRLRR